MATHEVAIKSAHDVHPALLQDFYKSVYPDRRNNSIWAWLNRSHFYENRIPLVAISNERVIGHAGMIPFNVLVNGKPYTASWYIDFAVVPGLQKSGVGKLLTEKWMECSDLCVTYCNEKSIQLFKKYGWLESFDTYLHRFFFRPFDQPKLARITPNVLRNSLNACFSWGIKWFYRWKSEPSITWKIEPLTKETLSEHEARLVSPKEGVVPVRDHAYFSWRILESPSMSDYYVATMGAVSVIVKAPGKQSSAYIDLLSFSSSTDFLLMKNLIAHIAIWGIDKGYSYIRYYSSDKQLSVYLQRQLLSHIAHPRFGFFSKNEQLFSQAKATKWYWELIDSDFEGF